MAHFVVGRAAIWPPRSVARPAMKLVSANCLACVTASAFLQRHSRRLKMLLSCHALWQYQTHASARRLATGRRQKNATPAISAMNRRTTPRVPHGAQSYAPRTDRRIRTRDVEFFARETQGTAWRGARLNAVSGQTEPGRS